MFDKLKYIYFFSFLAVAVFASESEIPAEDLGGVQVTLEEGTSPGLPDTAGIAGSGGEYANLDTVFERVIGLGNVCLTKSVINSFFNPHEDAYKTKKGYSDIFDWMFIYDYNLLSLSINEKLTNIFEKNDFIKTDWIENKAVFNQKYHMQWNHLFDNRFAIYSSHATENWNQYISLEFFNTFYDKINYLKDKFINAKNKRTIYLICDYGSNKTLNQETIINLRNSILNIRDNDKRFILLIISENTSLENFENIIVENKKINWEPYNLGLTLKNFKFSLDIWD